MREPIEGGSGQSFVAKDFRPILERQIRRDQNAVAFVGGGNHVEQQLRPGLAGRNVTEFIQNQQIQLAKLSAQSQELALAKWAETQPDGDRIHDALFRAYFVDNVNLAQIENLVAIAERIGLPVAEARRVLEERLYHEAVDADWQRSRDLGVTGVPTFVIGNRGLVGAQPYEQLAEFVESAGAVRRGT